MAAKQTDIIISGAGAAGLTLSLLLARGGLKVHIIDPANKAALSNDAPNGRSVALMNSSLNILNAAHVWPGALIERSNPLETMRLMDVSIQGRAPLVEDFDASDIGEAQFSYNVPNPLLRAALFKAASAEPNITLHLGRTLHIYDADTQRGFVTATLDDGAEIRGRLLVGADGRESRVREIAGIETLRSPYQQSAITCLINHSQSHNNVSTEFHRPQGPLAFVPLPGNQSSVVWVNDTARANEIMDMGAQDFIDALETDSHGILGGLSLAAEAERYPLCAIKAKTLSATRMALVAEAAHVMSPITAQGLNLSLRDVAALAETVIDAARLGGDIGGAQVLNAYTRRRTADIETRSFGVDRMNRIVSNDITAVKTARHIGLKTLGALPPLKRAAMHIGLAPALDNGRLMRGKKL